MRDSYADPADSSGVGGVSHDFSLERSSITRYMAGTISRMIKVAKRIPNAIDMAMGIRNLA